MRVKRQGIIVYFQQMKNVRHLKKYGHLIHASKKRKYAVIYVNREELEEKMETLNKLSYVLRVEPSWKPQVETDFENAKPDKAKEYDYKFGI
ncbi:MULTISPECIES: YlbG family protein [Salimicrobium]|uniref:UPF0298 protein AAV35_007560 n=4 Tax=Salimicrobium TaxID=351195 RepID=K2H828_9BACI|nr:MULTISPECIES: DUF2129 domain-containing protein [Salimicrobium]AKG04668.1 hypothetical protein AAV35_007560 [Salimicrobium jeotgali]EKE31835.1 hypothetical protein MJ3_06838 [Salimicrobium jeotgali]MBM7696202.1 uncharacterized protein YlbG (UPF0298 family) [Salimicrobium jeotgali]PBB05293.1 DUF2129 domain-containing protein [Salimicrobium humidisoli]SDX34351.1 Uncharacterized protein YlbG, UPF0298 family [Salimicrobium album]